MTWIKKDPSLKTVPEVILSHSGMREEDFDPEKTWNTKIVNLDVVEKRLRKIAEEGKTVTVFADYDCDGICSAVIMNVILGSLKLRGKIMFPHRKTGYGIKPEDVEKINSDVIITVDNGIAAHDAIKAAKEKGIEVIVIDHHLPPEELPNADIIIDPHLCKENKNDFEDWCGAGLAYELARKIAPERRVNIALQFAAIATIADVVPLKKDNREIVINGLKALNETTLSSMKSFLSAVADGPIDETTIGFKIAPIINAMGRIEDNAEYVYKYFVSGNPEMREHMLEVNEKRKEMVEEAIERAHTIIRDECLFADIPMIIVDSETPDGILGIIAGRLAEEFNVPVICLTESEEGVLKGSARSPLQTINLFEVLNKVDDLLLNFGGHSGAAGISLKEDNLDELKNRFVEIFSDYEAVENEDVYYDLEIDASEINKILMEQKKYAPFGEGNPSPVFRIKNFRLLPRNGKYYRLLGKDSNTIKLFGDDCSAIGFGMGERFNNSAADAKRFDLVGTLSENSFNNKNETQIELKDFQSLENKKEQSDLSKLLAKKLGDLKYLS